MEDVVAETARLRVRPWRHEEAPRLLDLLGRVEVQRWLDSGPPVLMESLDQAHASIDRHRERSQVPPRGFWAVEVRETGLVAGSVLLLTLPDAEADEVEIGWHLHPDSQGHGYAREAAAAVLARAFAHGLPEVWAGTHVDNRASQAVALAIGMTYQGIAERWYDGPSRFYRAAHPEAP